MKYICQLAFLFNLFAAGCAGLESVSDFQFGAGYRKDVSKWKMHAPASVYPKTHSSLSFKDPEIFLLSAKVTSVLEYCLYVRLDGDYGWITADDLTEKDSWGSKNGNPKFRAKLKNPIKTSYVYDISSGIGYPLTFDCWGLFVAPLFGYSYTSERITVSDKTLLQDVLTAAQINQLNLTPITQSSTGVPPDSHYQFRYHGPWVGVDAVFRPWECFSLYCELEYHYYHTHRMRSSNTGFAFFDSYTKKGKGHGYKITFGEKFNISCHWAVGLCAKYQRTWSQLKGDSLQWKAVSGELNVDYAF